MMIHAYNELYLNDAMNMLASMFDYAVNDMNIDIELFTDMFVSSKYCREIERGNPSYISGKSGIEIAQNILTDTIIDIELNEAKIRYNRTKEYWLGYVLAYYQWWTCKRFENIFRKINVLEILSMYDVFHEMDLSNFVESMNARYDSVIEETKLKRMREARGLSQSELASLSGVSLRSIQLYEQKVNNIDKAQSSSLYKLSIILGCDIEDLLEEPEKY